jgi:GxxExxY protein
VPDLICFGKIVVELKAVSALTDEHRAQVHNYLKATGHSPCSALLRVNFGAFSGGSVITRDSRRWARGAV